MKVLRFGLGNHEHVEIRVIGYAYPCCGEQYDDNWINAEIGLGVGRFRATFPAFLQTTDFSRLQRDLGQFYRTLDGSVTFETIEDQLKLIFNIDKCGHIHIDGAARDEAGTGNTLKFQLDFDQTYMTSSLSELDSLVEMFPFRG
jgi:hypothetical protein